MKCPENKKHNVYSFLLFLFFGEQHRQNQMISFCVCLLDNFTVFYNRNQDKNLQYSIQNVEDDQIVFLNDLSHVFIKLVLVAITLNNIVLVDKSKNVAQDFATKAVIVGEVCVVVLSELLGENLHFFVADDEQQLVSGDFNNIIRILRLHGTEHQLDD